MEQATEGCMTAEITQKDSIILGLSSLLHFYSCHHAFENLVFGTVLQFSDGGNMNVKPLFVHGRTGSRLGQEYLLLSLPYWQC